MSAHDFASSAMAQPFQIIGWCKPETIAVVELLGQEWTIAFELDGPYEREFFAGCWHEATPRRAVPVFVKMGGQWFGLVDVFTDAFCDAITEELNRMPWGDE